jgi:hypothetical protein
MNDTLFKRCTWLPSCLSPSRDSGPMWIYGGTVIRTNNRWGYHRQYDTEDTDCS